MLIDTRSLQRKSETELSEARMLLKIKTEELDRVNNIYQETLANLTAHKLEN
jgi:progesterone-induced-blocking factor 1